MCSFKWAAQGHAAGQGMVFAFAVLNKVDHFMQVCPKSKMGSELGLNSVW